MKFKLINRKTKDSLDLTLDEVIRALFLSIEQVLKELDDLKADLDDLTDFVEDNLD